MGTIDNLISLSLFKGYSSIEWHLWIPFADRPRSQVFSLFGYETVHVNILKWYSLRSLFQLSKRPPIISELTLAAVMTQGDDHWLSSGNSPILKRAPYWGPGVKQLKLNSVTCRSTLYFFLCLDTFAHTHIIWLFLTAGRIALSCVWGCSDLLALAVFCANLT